MIVYVVKYWQTDGIRAREVNLLERGNCLTTDNGICKQFFSKNDFAYTLEEARDKVRVLRNKKIVSLVKQLDKIKSLEVKEHV